ncbi:MAG: hypothetical protein RLZZ227_3056 [Pseudomonadota bacterium]|jgi:uncharacterized protein (DUF934 family)
MPRLIDTAGVELKNPWHLLPRDGALVAPDQPPASGKLEDALASPTSHLIVNATLWQQHKQELLASGKQIAVWLDSDQHADMIAADLARIPLVALNFPGFMDGRSYSTAVVLRKHHGYKGELRAIGDVLRDQLFYMKRCGFTTFDLRDTVKLEDARRAFHDYSASYASTVEEPTPLFRRRG